MNKKKKVLIIEDDSLILKLENIIFKKSDYEVFSAMNGVDGLKIATEEKPDLIIVDYLLPCMSGLDVINAIRAEDSIKETPCVIVTAMVTEREINLFKESKANGYIVKPFNTDTFVQEAEKIAFGA